MPDIDDPNNSCRACEKNYNFRSKYRAHLHYVYHIALLLLIGNVNRKIAPDPNDSHHYCNVCKKSWMTQGGYRTHCKNVHFMILSHCIILNSNATINANHPEFCCTQCERFILVNRASESIWQEFMISD